MGVDVVDLRGQVRGSGSFSVLADPTGRRRRYLVGVGRLVACVVGVWLCGLVVAGLGLLPAPLAPLASLVGSPPSPPRLGRLAYPPHATAGPAPSPTGGEGGVHPAERLGGHGNAQGSHSGASWRKLTRASGHNPMKPVGHGRGVPGRANGLPAQSTAPAPGAIGGRPGSSPQPVVAGGQKAAGQSYGKVRSKAPRSEAPGQTQPASGSGSATPATQATTTRSSSAELPASALEHAEARGHEKTLTPP